MTKIQGAAAISIAVSATLIAIVFMFSVSSNRAYTRTYVKDAIQQYDSSVTKIRNAQYDTIINSLRGITKELKDTSHE